MIIMPSSQGLMIDMKCDKCSANAVMHQRYSGMSLCRAHFQEDVHRKIRETLRESKLFGCGARIAVALDGSADSATLIYVLKNLFSNRKDIELIAVMIDEGIEGYRPEAMSFAKRLAEQLKVPTVIKRFQDYFGVDMDKLAAGNEEPCDICKALKRSLLYSTAQEIGANAIATGQCLDDEACEIMDSYLRGDTEVQSLRRDKYAIPTIRPLRRVPANEVTLYAAANDLCFGSMICPHARGMCTDARRELREFEARHPGTNYSLLRSLERISSLGQEPTFRR